MYLCSVYKYNLKMSPRKNQKKTLKKPRIAEESSDEDWVEKSPSKPDDDWLKNSSSRPNFFDALTYSDDDDQPPGIPNQPGLLEFVKGLYPKKGN